MTFVLMEKYNLLSDEQCEAVAKNIKRFREELSQAMQLDVTQELLSEMSEVRLDTLRAYEVGRRRPGLAPLLQLSRVFGRPIEDMLSSDPPPPDPKKQSPFFVRFKIVGNAPPELKEEMAKLIAKYSPGGGERRAGAKRKLRKGE